MKLMTQMLLDVLPAENRCRLRPDSLVEFTHEEKAFWGDSSFSAFSAFSACYHIENSLLKVELQKGSSSEAALFFQVGTVLLCTQGRGIGRRALINKVEWLRGEATWNLWTFGFTDCTTWPVFPGRAIWRAHVNRPALEIISSWKQACCENELYRKAQLSSVFAQVPFLRLSWWANSWSGWLCFVSAGKSCANVYRPKVVETLWMVFGIFWLENWCRDIDMLNSCSCQVWWSLFTALPLEWALSFPTTGLEKTKKTKTISL